MPIGSWICRGCNRREVPLDHFAKTRCGEMVCHPDYAAAVLADRNKPRGASVSVTNGLSCPRRAAIEREELYAMDPIDGNSALTGTAWHAMMEKCAAEGAEVELRGQLAGIPVVGHVDRIRGDLVEDHKHIKTWSLKYKKTAGVDEEYRAQVSIYAELNRQMQRPPLTRGIIWYHTTDDGPYPVACDLMPIEEALALRPYSGDHSVLDLYRQMQSYVDGAHWSTLPLAGQTQKFGSKTACSFCSVREVCTVAAMGTPF